MDRLTFDGLFCDIALCQETPGGSYCENSACSQRKVWERLKAIEDILGDTYDLDRLRELVEAEREGRCVVLPCKPGDKVYQHRSKKHAKGIGVSPRFISSATVYGDGKFVMNHQGFQSCREQDLGKTWFLTREEAEKALEAQREN